VLSWLPFAYSPSLLIVSDSATKFIAVEECIDSHFIGVKEKTKRRWKRGPQSLNTESRVKLRMPEKMEDGSGKSVADAEAHHFLQLASARSAQPTRAAEIVRTNMTVILAVEAKTVCMNQRFNNVALCQGTTLEAAEIGLYWGEISEKRTSGAEALVDSAGCIPGINPRPTARTSISAASEVVPWLQGQDVFIASGKRRS
jgi:hypothetical protein